MFDAIIVDKTNPDNIYVGYGDIGFLKSADGGKSFCRSEIRGDGDLIAIAIDPDSPNIIYAAPRAKIAEGVHRGWLVRSTDYGESLTEWEV